jgi:hypothetical protein
VTRPPHDFSGIAPRPPQSTALRRLAAAGAVLAFVVVVLLPLLALAIPVVLAGDEGLDRFSGDERAAAQYAVEEVRLCADHPLDRLGMVRVRVLSVQRVPSDPTLATESALTGFRVTLRRYALFGISSKVVVQEGSVECSV